MPPLLQFDRVCKRYPSGTHALDALSFTIEPGEFVAIIGPSGSGKSTLLRAINRLIPVSSGSVLLEGRDLARLHGRALREQRRKIGMIFQNYNLVYRLSVLQNALHGRLGHLGFWRGLFGLYPQADRLHAQTLLSELGLGAFCRARAAELSGGQKQRVGIARAIMQDPCLLLADEPIASLDPASAITIMETLREQTRRRNLACLVNLHQLDIARTYATRVLALRKGKLFFDGKPEALTEAALRELYATAPAKGSPHDAP